MKLGSPMRIDGGAIFGTRLAQIYPTRGGGATGPSCPQTLSPEGDPGKGGENDARNCVSGRETERRPSSMAVPPAASPTGLPKNSAPAMVAILADCPIPCAVELASGLYAASWGFIDAKTVCACPAAGPFRST